MTKHAYLILTHHAFDVLEYLIKALDDSRNDIYIHVDKKVKEIPQYKTLFANLYMLQNRIDVRWGDVSVVNAEYALFEEASKKQVYAYYHLLSGVDMPLKSQHYIHAFFQKHQGKEFIGFYPLPIEKEIDRKVQRFHLFPKDFRDAKGLVAFLKKAIRWTGLKIQYRFGYRRNTQIKFRKGTQWVSITDDFVRYILKSKKEVLKMYKNSFCSDEIFIQTLCWNSAFKNKIFDPTNEERSCMRMIGWKNGVLYDWQNQDYESLRASELLFARKFNSENMEVVNRIFNDII
ncbi:glycosyl transferase [Elizabethkingia argentiflava]|uniref:Peptide O-xylosyltransferase n=1 Tax=Elizabethkingia argenteiflava TaxID=2681556 RepID=A0A845PXZ5_9FLAO|nr:beta-1,6-N-acetylglucosaminyltransferase [Elizabethkingia argenteiflava]NAW51337.1 glycosyl transferase [Elizabethkingia argenteiflava]